MTRLDTLRDKYDRYIRIGNHVKALQVMQEIGRLSTREYARRIGVTQRAVIKRRDRILRDMKKYFEKFAA